MNGRDYTLRIARQYLAQFAGTPVQHSAPFPIADMIRKCGRHHGPLNTEDLLEAAFFISMKERDLPDGFSKIADKLLEDPPELTSEMLSALSEIDPQLVGLARAFMNRPAEQLPGYSRMVLAVLVAYLREDFT